MCTTTHASYHADDLNVCERGALEYLFDVCTNTHASFHIEDFNVFKGGALEYLCDARLLTPLLT